MTEDSSMPTSSRSKSSVFLKIACISILAPASLVAAIWIAIQLDSHAKLSGLMQGYAESVRLGDDVDAALAPLVQGRLAPIGVQRRTAEEVWIGGMPFEKYQFECQVVLDVREERVVGVRYYTPDTNEAPLHAPPDRFLEPPPGDPVR